MANLLSDADVFGSAPSGLLSDADVFGKGAKTEPGGFVASAKQALGAGIKGAGQAAADFIPGVSQENALKRYGQEIIEANPTAVHSFSDLADKPWTAVKEATGNALSSMGGVVGARALGTGITAAAPLAGPAAPIVAGAGQAISWLGPVAAAALPSFGGIREQQIHDDPNATNSAAAKAAAAVGAGTVGAIESRFGPEAWGSKMLTEAGRNEVAKLFAAKTLPQAIAKGAVRGAAVEGAEELAQNPVEQLAAFQNPLTAEALKDTAFSGAMGALGGGVLGGGTGAASRYLPKKPDPPKALPAPTYYTGTPGYQTLQATVDRQNAVDAAQAATDALYNERDAFERERAANMGGPTEPPSTPGGGIDFTPPQLPDTGPLSRAANISLVSSSSMERRALFPFASFDAAEMARRGRADLVSRPHPTVPGRFALVPSGMEAPRGTGSFADQSELANFIADERKDQSARRAAIAEWNNNAIAQADQAVSDARQFATRNERLSILDGVLSSLAPGQNPNRRFDAALKAAGFRDTSFTEEERTIIGRYGNAASAFAEAPTTPVEPSSPNEMGDIIPAAPGKGNPGIAGAKIDRVRSAIAAGFTQRKGFSLINPATGEKFALKTPGMIRAAKEALEKLSATNTENRSDENTSMATGGGEEQRPEQIGSQGNLPTVAVGVGPGDYPVAETSVPSGEPAVSVGDGSERNAALSEQKSTAKPRRTRMTPLDDPRISKHAESLQAMAGDVGWAETGGLLLRDANGKANGRTQWIPHAEWFRAGMIGRPDDATKAVQKAVSGEPMSVKEKRTIQGMMDWLDHVDAHPNEAEALADMGYDDLTEPEQEARDALGDFDPFNPPVGDVAAGMRALGFTEEEIRAEIEGSQSRDSGQGDGVDNGIAGRGPQESLPGRDETRPSASEGQGPDERPSLELERQTDQGLADKAAREQEPQEPTKEQADRERDAAPFSLSEQSQPKPQGVQSGLFTADGRVSVEAKQPEKPAEVTKPKNEQQEAAGLPAATDGGSRPVPAVSALEETFRPLIERLIRNKRVAKELGFDIDGAIAKAKAAMAGTKQMPGSFRALAKRAEKKGDTETAAILNQVADLNDGRKAKATVVKDSLTTEPAGTHEFIKAPDGSIDFGEITGEQAKAVEPAKYKGPDDVSTRAGQMELSNRAGTIATLKAMNEQLRKIAPDEAWADSNIEDAQNLDALRDQISQAIVDAQRGKPIENALRKELEELSGQELKDVFSKFNLAGKLMAYEERISALLMEDAAEVRAAISAVTGNPSESTAQPVKATTEAKAVEPWQMTRDEFFDQGDAPVRNALISSGLGKIELQGYRTTYEYESPAPSGPFKGVTVTRSQQPVGSIIGMPFGRAVVKTSTKLKGGQAILDRGELFELGKEYHKRVVADAIADGKPVPANVLADYPDLKPKSVEPAAQSAEQKIRSAFDALPSVSLGVAYPITVEHNGVKREFMVRQDALGKGKIPALHVVAIHQGRMIASDAKSWIAQSYKLNWKNELTEEGLPKKISDQEADEFKANFKGKPAAVDAKKEAETDDGIRYSKVSDAPAGEELVAIHNLTSENVLHAAAIGGIPVPSIGITKLSSPFTDFGEITLIADKGMIDPENSVPVFDRDAYTARFPEFNYKKVTAKKADAFYERMNVARELGDDGQSFISQLWDAVKNARVQSPKKVADLFRTYLAPRMLYAKEVLGKEIKAPMIPIKASVFFGHEKSWRDFVKNNAELKRTDEDAYNAAAAKAIKIAANEFIDRASADNEIRSQIRSAYMAEVDRYAKDSVNWNYLDRAIKSAQDFGKKRVDAVALSNRVAKIVPQDDPGYLRWVSNEISDLFVAPTITLRGKEVEASLDNIVEAMTIGKTNGAEKTMTFGVGKTSALLGKRFKSIKEIQDHRNQVVSSSRESEMKKDSEKLLEEYRLKAVEHFTHTDWKGRIDTFAGFDAAMEALAKAGKGALTDGNIASAMRSVGFKNVPNDVINLARQGIVSIREASTDYFEAKPQRAVKLNEFNGAIVPNGTAQEVIDALKSNGITDIRTYKRGDEEGRKKSVALLAKKIHAQNNNTLFSNSAEGATQSAPITRTEAESRIKSILGDKLGKVLIDSGIVTFTNKGSEYQGATYKDGSIALNLDALNADNFAGVFAHEGFHSTIRDLVGEQTYTQMMKRLDTMLAMGKGAQWVKDADAAIPSDTKAEHRTEEIAAYSIEQYVNGAKQPNIITRWVESLLSALRTAIIRRLPSGKLKSWAVNNLQPQDLANLAIAGLKAKAAGQVQAQGREAMAYSTAFGKDSQHRTPLGDATEIEVDGIKRPALNSNGKPIHWSREGVENFWRWFSDSKAVDAEGRPLVVYHGTSDDFTVFGNKYAGRTWEMFSDSSEYSNRFASSRGGRLVPVYLSLRNPLDMRSLPAIRGDVRNKLIPLLEDAGVKFGNNFKMSDLPYERDLFQIVNMAGHKSGFADAVMAAGYDGIIMPDNHDGDYLDDGGIIATTYIALNPGQIKSAIGNSGDFDGTNPDIRYSRAQIIGDSGRQSAFDIPESSKMDDVIYAMQDKHIDLKRVVESIKKTAGSIADNIDPYLQEELFHGRAAKAVKDFLDLELRPLIAEMRMRGVGMADFEEYLWNRHAEERNAQIAKINPQMPDGGSGLATADARAYLAGLSSDKRKAYESLAAKIDAITARNRQVLVDSGLEKAETVAAWEGAYKHYIPLQREDVETGGNGTGQGFSVRGTSSKRAVGSGRPVADIIANLAMQRERFIVKAEKNRVSIAIAGLAASNPNPDFWKLNEAPKERVVNNVAIYNVLDANGNKVADFTRMDEAERMARSMGGEVEQTWGDRVQERIVPGFKNQENVVHFRLNGEDHFVVFNEREPRALRMAQSIKNLDMDQLGRVLTVAGKATRYFASINTQYNPIFGVINLFRDVQGALLNLSTTPLAGEQKRVAGYTVDALRGIYADIRAHRSGKVPSSRWASLYEEFQNEGGQTGYRDQFSNAEQRAEAIAKEIRSMDRNVAFKAAGAVFDWLSDYNQAMENAVRLAAYAAAKERGLSKQQAASLAKNLTVNFNRKGQVATQMGALYAFFNASMQGTARLAQTLTGPMGRRIITGGILLGSMQALLLASAGMGDDEPPEFVRERNLILPIGDGKYISLPMPLGFHVLPNLGRIPVEFVMSGFREPARRISDLVAIFADTFNPIGNAGLSLQTIAPTVVDPFAALAENKDWTGKPIAKMDMNANSPTPGHSRAKDTSTVWSKSIAEAINYLSGGTKYKPGVVSPTPDQIDYLIGQVTGGVGREAAKAEQTVTSTIFTGEELPLHKVPLVGRFVGDTKGQSAEGSKFYAALQRINEHENEIKGMRKDGRGAEIAGYIQDNPEARLMLYSNHVEREVQKLRAAKRDALERGDEGRVRMIESALTAKMRAFNERVRSAQGSAN